MLRVVSNDERVETLETVLEQMDEIAHALRSLHDREVDAYCLADFEGREGGWLGEFVRDILERKLREYRDGEEEDET
jgi:hypothetical protein